MSVPLHPALSVASAPPHDSVHAILTRPGPILHLGVPAQLKINASIEGPLVQVSRWHDFNFQNLHNAFRDILSYQAPSIASETRPSFNIHNLRALSTFGVEYLSRNLEAPIAVGPGS